MALVDMCRLCGTDTRDIVRNAIFEDEGRSKKYALKISECLTLQVTEEDELPKVMCGECSVKLDMLSDFRDEAYKTETKLLSKILFKKEEPDAETIRDLDSDKSGGEIIFRLISPELLSELEFEIKEEEIQDKKMSASKIYWKKSGMQEPKLISSEGSLGDIACYLSSPEIQPDPVIELQIKEEDALFKKKSATKRSMRESETETPPKKRRRKPKEFSAAAATLSPAAAPPKQNAGPLAAAVDICQVCHESFASYADLQRHWCTCVKKWRQLKVRLQRLTAEQLKPPTPSAQLQKSKPLRDLKLFLCEYEKCRHVFTCPARLQSHKQMHTGRKLFRCSRCFNYFPSQTELEQHTKSTHLSGCDVQRCTEKIPASKLDSTASSVVVTSARVYVCEYCGTQLESTDSYLSHVKSMHPRSCQNSSVDDHDLKKRPLLVCDVMECKFTCRYMATLENHKLGAHKNVVFACLLCGVLVKPANFKHHLQRHQTSQAHVTTPAEFAFNFQG